MALKFIRDNLKSFFWILWVVIFAMVGLVFFEWGGYNQQASASTDVAATVGGEKITFGEFQIAHRRLEDYYRQAFGDQFNQELIEQFNLPAQALNQLVNERILLREARAIGLTVSDQEIREVIVNDPNLQRDGRFVGAEEYEQLLRRNRRTPKEHHELIRQSLLLQKLDSVLAASVYVSDDDVEEAYRDQVERAKIRYVELAASQMEEAAVETADLEAHLAAHPEDFEIPERRVVDYLLVDTGKLRQEVEIPEEEVRAYYDENQDQYTRQEQVRARHILRKITEERTAEEALAEVEDIKRRIEGGEDFATLARELSEDDMSARNGGTLQPFGRGAMLPSFEEAAFNAADGALIDPVQTDYGYHLIEKLGSTPAGVQPFEQVQAVIRARLLGERVNQIAEEKSLDISGRVTVEMSDEDLRALAAEEGLTVTTTAPFGVEDTVAGLGRNASFNQAAFGLETGAISEPIRVPRGWAVIKLQEVQAPRSPELAEVEDLVRQAVSDERRREAAVASLRGAAEGGKSLDDLAGEMGLEVEEPAEFGKQGSVGSLGRNREVIDLALTLAAGEIGGPFATDNGAVLFEVAERKTFDSEEFQDAKDSTRVAQEDQHIQNLKRSIVEQRRRELATSYHPNLAQNFNIGA